MRGRLIYKWSDFLQHSNYSVTAKHYIDRKEIANQMAKQGFRVFPKRSSEIMILTVDEIA